jgi:hypothetical protein
MVVLFLFSEINSGFFYKSAVERDEMVKAERKFIDDRVDKIIALKKKVVGGKLPPLGFTDDLHMSATHVRGCIFRSALRLLSCQAHVRRFFFVQTPTKVSLSSIRKESTPCHLTNSHVRELWRSDEQSAATWSGAWFRSR